MIEEVKKRMRELIESLKKWNYEYFFLDDPSVTDSFYDEKIRELINLEKNYNFFFHDSPTKNVGLYIDAKNTKIKKIKRKRDEKMLSLDSVNNYYSLIVFDKKVKKVLKKEKEIDYKEIDYINEWKIDGLSISILYKDGKLSQIATRGNGIIGEDVTFNKLMIRDIPLSLENIKNCEIRGEVYMRKKEFEELNQYLSKNNKKIMSNPRNAASGSLRNFENSENRKLNFFAYQIFLKEKNMPENQYYCLEFLKKLGFSIAPNNMIFKNIEEVWRDINEREKLRNYLDFESDGVVIKVNDYKYHNFLGENNKFPKWALAYKFTSPFKKSYLRDIKINLSRSGRVNYIAKINPVKIQGSIISNVSLHNFDFIKKKKINIGDELVVEKAGDIIPQITKVIKVTKNKENDYWIPPKKCQFCLSHLIWNKNNKYQVCINDECKERNIKVIIHFLSKEGLDIKWINEKTVRKLYEEGIIKYSTDIFLIYQKKDKIAEIDGFKDKRIEKIFESIELAKKKNFSQFLSALGIPMLGLIKAEKLINSFSSFEILKIIEMKKWEEIEKILGKKTRESFENYFLIKINEMNLRKILEFFN